MDSVLPNTKGKVFTNLVSPTRRVTAVDTAVDPTVAIYELTLRLTPQMPVCRADTDMPDSTGGDYRLYRPGVT